MEGKTVVLYPGLGVVHLSPMLEPSERLLRHSGGAVDVVVVLVEPPFQDPSFADTVARVRASHASTSFHVLPSPLPPACVPSSGDADHLVVGMLRFLRATNAPLRDLLRSLSSFSVSRPVGAVVLDMFCAHELDVVAELGIPAYFFFATGAAALTVFLALPDTCLASRVPEARGILVNSFDTLEPRDVRALRDRLCVPGRSTPPVYCVGLLVSPGSSEKEHECLRWMDAQPDRSVVFLCFGSMGALPKHQLVEIAAGLESSEQRFLWVVRSAPGSPVPEPAGDIDAVLLAGFRERTKDRGLIVRS